MIAIVLFGPLCCVDASTEGEAVVASYTRRGTHRYVPSK